MAARGISRLFDEAHRCVPADFDPPASGVEGQDSELGDERRAAGFFELREQISAARFDPTKQR
jgi:hypothetical protein